MPRRVSHGGPGPQRERAQTRAHARLSAEKKFGDSGAAAIGRVRTRMRIHLRAHTHRGKERRKGMGACHGTLPGYSRSSILGQKMEGVYTIHRGFPTDLRRPICAGAAGARAGGGERGWRRAAARGAPRRTLCLGQVPCAMSCTCFRVACIICSLLLPMRCHCALCASSPDRTEERGGQRGVRGRAAGEALLR